jgi:hypothetical protein
MRYRILGKVFTDHIIFRDNSLVIKCPKTFQYIHLKDRLITRYIVRDDKLCPTPTLYKVIDCTGSELTLEIIKHEKWSDGDYFGFKAADVDVDNFISFEELLKRLDDNTETFTPLKVIPKEIAARKEVFGQLNDKYKDVVINKIND